MICPYIVLTSKKSLKKPKIPEIPQKYKQPEQVQQLSHNKNKKLTVVDKPKDTAPQSKKLVKSSNDSFLKNIKTADLPNNWQPLKNNDYGFKSSNKARIEKDKYGNIRYRGNNGKFAKSPFKEAKEIAKKGERDYNLKISGNVAEKNNCIIKDFGRVQAGDNSDIQTGPRTYAYNDANLNFSKNNISANLGGGAGINLASGKHKSALGESRLDVNGPSANVGIGGKLQRNDKKEIIELEGEMEAIGKALDVTAEYTTDPICIGDNCYELKISPSAGIGVGAAAKIGYKQHENKKGGKLTIEVAGGTGAIIGTKVSIDSTPNKSQAKSPDTNKPSKISP